MRDTVHNEFVDTVKIPFMYTTGETIFVYEFTFERGQSSTPNGKPISDWFLTSVAEITKK